MFFSPVKKTIKKLLEDSKGILAADETPATIGKRFAALGIENTEQNRRAYREMLFTTPNISHHISGVILQDETIRQSTKEGILFTDVLKKQGVVIGIKVDLGLKPFKSSTVEKVTDGLETLAKRLPEYYKMGARFAKWRAALTISSETPSSENIEVNMQLLADYAALCLKHKIVPIVEPEVLADGDHSIEKTYTVTSNVLKSLFRALSNTGVDIRNILLKPNMVVPGEGSSRVLSEVVAKYTVRCFEESVPNKVPGIVFLSGGQTEEEACDNLRAISTWGRQVPWKWSFSFGRALQNSAMKEWAGKAKNVTAAQMHFFRQAMKVSDAASAGKR